MKTLEEAKGIFERELKEYMARCATSYITQPFFGSGPDGAARAQDFIDDMREKKISTVQDLISLVDCAKYKEGKHLPPVLIKCLFEVAEITEAHIDYIAEGVAKDWNKTSYWGVIKVTS